MMKISSQLLLILPLAMGIGIAMAFQTAINSQLREYLYSPLQAALSLFFGWYNSFSHTGIFSASRKTQPQHLAQHPMVFMDWRMSRGLCHQHEYL